MLWTLVWLAVFITSACCAAVVFLLNDSTPLQLGPAPFFVSASIAVIALIAVIARTAG